MNYKIIRDKTKFREFIDWLPDLKESEKFYCSLFARKKYCKNIKSIKSDKAQLKRFLATKENLYQKVKKLECEIGSYKQKNTISVPQEALALYININPRDLWKATFNSLIKLSKCIRDSNKNMNPVAEVLSEIQKSESKTRYVIFDLDSKNKRELNACISYVNIDAVKVIETRGGFHILINPSKLKDTVPKTWYNRVDKASMNIDQKGDLMSPVVGCTQGNFTPKFLL